MFQISPIIQYSNKAAYNNAKNNDFGVKNNSTARIGFAASKQRIQHEIQMALMAIQRDGTLNLDSLDPYIKQEVIAGLSLYPKLFKKLGLNNTKPTTISGDTLDLSKKAPEIITRAKEQNPDLHTEMLANSEKQYETFDDLKEAVAKEDFLDGVAAAIATKSAEHNPDLDSETMAKALSLGMPLTFTEEEIRNAQRPDKEFGILFSKKPVK